ncbi:hypothetical protein [Maricaulis sp.]|uniref:hypothetical protein n=1 Tax=Maricaulis sp. TaxID=1486257 RepID=UPI002612CDBE|nr:hypothetical protein [Maricaulis sp.]
MKSVVFATALVAALPIAAAAQDRVRGVYDGRNVEGWTYSEEGSEAAGLPTWIPEGGAVAGANCNIEVTEVEATRAEWLDAFNAADPAMVGAQLRAQGVDWRQGYLTEVITMHDRPAMRNLWAGAYENQGFEAMQVSISGRNNLVLVRCTIQTGYLLPALYAFYGFAENIEINTRPPR